MPKYPKSKPDVKFNGQYGIYYDSMYIYTKIEFKLENKILKCTFYQRGYKNFPTKQERTFKIFENTMCELLLASVNSELGRHFERGLADVYKALELDFGYVMPILKKWE